MSVEVPPEAASDDSPDATPEASAVVESVAPGAAWWTRASAAVPSSLDAETVAISVPVAEPAEVATVSDEPDGADLAPLTPETGPAAGAVGQPVHVAPPRPRHIHLTAPVVLLVIALIGFSMGTSLTSPGTDSWSARLSGWARDHHLGGVVNEAERIQYGLHKPKTGGTPAGGIPVETPPPSLVPVQQLTTPAPPPVVPFATPALPGEGQWQTLVSVHGQPAIRETFIRPDAQHTSYLTSIAWMDQKLLSFQLHPGTQEPGHGPWQTSDRLAGPDLHNLVAAFNSGFKLDGARGGYYAEDRVVKPLRVGGASMVVYRNGTMAIGEWGRDFTMSRDIASVRQNLDLLIDNGKLAPTVDEDNTATWGFTLGNKDYVWRSGIGITRTGAIVYAAGNALNVRSIGQVLLAAGAVRAMELDINPAWTTYYWYQPSPSGMVGHKLSPDMQKPVDRYFETSSRDFYAVHIR